MVLYRGRYKTMAELDGSNRLMSVFVYASRSHVPDYMIKSGVTYRIVSDHLGSVRLVVRSNTGAIVQRLDYDDFDRVAFDSNPGFQPFGYAGGLYDPDTGLTRFGLRDFDPGTGRWLSKDPIGFAGGLNLYVYCHNDPINYIDIFGLGDEGYTSDWDQIWDRWTDNWSMPETWTGDEIFEDTIIERVMDVLFPELPSDLQIAGMPGSVKFGPSGKPMIHMKHFPSLKAAKDAARQAGKGSPIKHPNPQKGNPHYHPSDSKGNKIPGSAHYEYPD